MGSSLKISKCRKVKTPTRGTVESAGIDFYVPEESFGHWPITSARLNPGKSVNIPSGIKAKIPVGYALIAFNKSGMALKGLQVGACVVDSDYQGEIHLHVINTTTEPIEILVGQKLVQFILIPYAHCNIIEIEEGSLYPEKTERGEGGFGSTNEK